MILQKLYERTPGFELEASRTAADCSITELYVLHTSSITSLQTRADCLSTVTMFFVPSQGYSRYGCQFSLVFRKLYKGSPVPNQGPLGCSRMLYHRAISPLHTDSITSLETLSGCLSTDTRFFVPSQVFSCDRWLFSLLTASKTLLQTCAAGSNSGTILALRRQIFFCDFASHFLLLCPNLSDCSRMLYHWAISPLQTDSLTSLQTRSGCLSTVTLFFVPSQVFSRDRWYFSLVFQK